jgi:hypothetical protein
LSRARNVVATLGVVLFGAAPVGAQTAPAPGSRPAPFGPGAEVQLTSSGKPVSVFVARIEQGMTMPLPDSSFVKVGTTPITIILPPGSYEIDVQGVDISHESMLFEMRGEPRHLLVRTGSEGLGTAGTLLLGAGVIGIVGGFAVLLSGSKYGDYDKKPILIPMFAGGAVLFGAGLGMTIASQTKVDDEHPAAPMPGVLRQASVGVGFSF